MKSLEEESEEEQPINWKELRRIVNNLFSRQEYAKKMQVKELIAELIQTLSHEERIELLAAVLDPWYIEGLVPATGLRGSW